MNFIGLAKRNFKEIVRDPLTTLLGIVAPSLLLIIFVLINQSSSLPIDIFDVNNLVPGIVIFGFSFLMMFSAMLLSKDRQSSLFDRFQTLPLSEIDFVLAYSLPFLFVAFMQIIVTYIIGIILGLTISWMVLLSVLIYLPIAILFISLGLVLGCLCSENQISGIGTLIITFTSLFSGAWMDLTISSFTQVIGYSLPFSHGIDAVRELSSAIAFDATHLYYIVGYFVLVSLVCVYTFYTRIKHKKNKNNKSK